MMFTEAKELRNIDAKTMLVRFDTERYHQGLDNKLIVPLEAPPDVDTEVKTTERLGGLLHTYR